MAELKCEACGTDLSANPGELVKKIGKALRLDDALSVSLPTKYLQSLNLRRLQQRSSYARERWKRSASRSKGAKRRPWGW